MLRDNAGVGVRLCQNPVTELQLLRGERLHLANQVIAEGNSLLSSGKVQGELMEVVARFRPGTATEFGFQLRKCADGQCTVGYNGAKQTVFVSAPAVRGGPAQTLLPRDKVIELHVLLDRSVVDVFGNGERHLALRNPSRPIRKTLVVKLYAKGGTVDLLELLTFGNSTRRSPGGVQRSFLARGSHCSDRSQSRADWMCTEMGHRPPVWVIRSTFSFARHHSFRSETYLCA